MSTQNAIETEVKIAVPHWKTSEVTTRLFALGLKLTEPRVFEANFVYDMPSKPSVLLRCCCA